MTGELKMRITGRSILALFCAGLMAGGLVLLPRRAGEQAPSVEQIAGDGDAAPEEGTSPECIRRQTRERRVPAVAQMDDVKVPDEAWAAVRAGGTREDVEALYAFLEDARVPEGLEPGDVHELKNEMLNSLRCMPVPPRDLGRELIRIHRNPDQDEVIRDYALQHLGLWYEHIRLGGATVARREEELAGIRAVLRAALEQTDGSFAGTALLVSLHLSGRFSEFSRADIGRAAHAMAGDGACADMTRTTAIRVCGQLGLAEALSTALDVAGGSGPVVLRMAAIATVGDIGGPETATVLEGVAGDPDARIRSAGDAALQQMRERNGI